MCLPVCVRVYVCLCLCVYVCACGCVCAPRSRCPWLTECPRGDPAGREGLPCAPARGCRDQAELLPLSGPGQMPHFLPPAGLPPGRAQPVPPPRAVGLWCRGLCLAGRGHAVDGCAASSWNAGCSVCLCVSYLSVCISAGTRAPPQTPAPPPPSSVLCVFPGCARSHTCGVCGRVRGSVARTVLSDGVSAERGAVPGMCLPSQSGPGRWVDHSLAPAELVLGRIVGPSALGSG